MPPNGSTGVCAVGGRSASSASHIVGGKDYGAGETGPSSPTTNAGGASALIRYARGNQVTMILMGAATHGLQMQRFVDTVPIRVARDAPCTVILVKQALPFEQLAQPLPG